ncbi:hypothetical protein V565_297650, partial [Rhizoctonia solani 123E]
MADEPALLKPALDENLPEIYAMSLEDWNRMYDLIAATRGLIARDIFALTGHFPDPEDQGPNPRMYRAAFDISTCTLPAGMVIRQKCDIDSIIAIILGNLPLKPNFVFDYFMLADIRHTLNSNLHIPGIVPLHMIPNCRFGEVEGFLIRSFFPGLIGDERLSRQKNKNYVSEEFLRPLYDLAIRQAANNLPGDVSRRFPATFGNEMFRAAGNAQDEAGEAHAGPAQQSAKRIPGQYYPAWMADIQRFVEETPELVWAVGMILVLEKKGMKNTRDSDHLPPEEPLAIDGNLIDPRNSCTRAIRRLLQPFDIEGFEPRRLYLDIATTVSASITVDGEERPVSLFVKTEYHPQIMNHFTGMPINDCELWARTSSGGYSKDEDAHLGSLGGLRHDVREPGELGVENCQVYPTSKDLIYNLNLAHKAKRTSPHKIISNWKTERSTFYIPLQETFLDASPAHDIAIRFESRSEYESYPYIHLFLPLILLAQWLVWMENPIY